MEIIFNIWPRQSGKTLAAVDILLNTENCLYVCRNGKDTNDLSDSLLAIDPTFSKSDFIVDSNSLRVTNFLNRVVPFETVVLDEYLFFNNQKEVYETLRRTSSIKKVIIFSTSNKKYYTEVLDFLREEKPKDAVTAKIELKQRYLKSLSINAPVVKEVYSQIDTLYHNFLGDPDTIFTKTIRKNGNVDAKKYILHECYEIEFENKWLVPIPAPETISFRLAIMDFVKENQNVNYPKHMARDFKERNDNVMFFPKIEIPGREERLLLGNVEVDASSMFIDCYFKYISAETYDAKGVDLYELDSFVRESNFKLGVTWEEFENIEGIKNFYLF